MKNKKLPQETHKFPVEQVENSVKQYIKLNSVPNLVGGVQLNQGGLKNGK
jgi:hypothetical protein